jgi:signal transduction histidine kinase
VVVHETTRIVKLQAALRRQESFALVGSVVAAVAHDVRNPLAILSVSLDALEIDFDGDPRLVQGLEPLRRSIARLTDLMQALLAYGSPAGQDWAEVNVADLVASVHASQRVRARDVSVIMKVSLPSPQACVVGQHGRLLRVFENVIDNAVQFAPAASEVAVEVDRLDDADGAWVRCRVRDRGPGFDESAMPRLFEPFFTTRRGGTGLGLAIAHRIVEQHGGRIAAANAPGGGAVVTVDLPLAGQASRGVRR